MAPSDDLFDHAMRHSDAGPLAERMRPATLQEMAGHEALLGPEGALARWARAKRPISLVIWGPPGSGKTTLAHALARAYQATLVPVSAVTCGVAQLRAAIEAATTARKHHGTLTFLFVDEIHRFNRAQQDALLPHVESGMITLLGATTENPSIEVNAALLSRCRVVHLAALAPEVVARVLRRALEDPKQGLGRQGLKADNAVLIAIARHSHGDVRRALGTLEATAALAQADGRDALTMADAAVGAQDRTLGHDRAGDAHYNLLSALIKSMRHSDADAAVYYLARLIEGGEAPRSVLRRMVIFASEDVGLADPQALTQAVATYQAFEMMGLPEGKLPLTQLALYLARAPKSREVIDTSKRATQAVLQHGPAAIPAHLINAVGVPAKPLEPQATSRRAPTSCLPEALGRIKLTD